MNIYAIRAIGLATFMKTEKPILNLKSTEDVYSLIDIDNTSKLCFNERLSIVNEKEEELGEFVGKIRKSGSNTKPESLMIILNSTSIHEHGKEIGFSVITTTTTDFLSYEEKWSQWTSNKSNMTCKTVLISNKNNDGSIQIYTDLNNSELIDQTKNINLKYIKNLLTEGMNYAFLRYLAIMGFEGTINNKTAITINGTLCKTKYICSLKDNYKIKKIAISVVIIKRVIKLEKSLKTPVIRTITVLTRLGYILHHSWGKTINQKLVINKSMQITKDGFVYNDTMAHLKNNMDQDIRFKSMYLNKISEMKIKYKTYIKNNRDVNDMTIDYIKAVLIAKPDNVLQFSIDYFKELNNF
ncbi:LOW QUALITY PROTEIN: ciliogenesis-associated TTC17-interacting protein-like [Myzus persicae]|uniref:LOW QUALITY PROTEIN: ciliogenesis-associated TTC17-interacting protein-like n=1 Tax=Myzus persicae TaxID=13164 RepID=UPI000B931970|nr:LOW QUALITY PROTEIN: ciliogenesis-associated TTC17-interacting protein-like [Myzus persicae]